MQGTRYKIAPPLPSLSMLHKKYPKKEVASLLEVNNGTVTDWVKIYNKAGQGLIKYYRRWPSALDSIKDEIASIILEVY